MGRIAVAGWLLPAVALAAIAGCSTEASLNGTPNDELSAQLQPQLASCLGLPEDAVQLKVDNQRRLLMVSWQGPSGFKPATSQADCLRRLNISADKP